MKVVLFCGGFGTRLRDYSEEIPKPLVPLGNRPLLWHVMMYYAYYGHKDFVLCLGYKGEAIKRYFLNYDECLSNDFVLTQGAKQIELLRKDIEDWRITFVDTGLNSNIGMRLKAVEPHVKDEPVFLANYSDGFTDFPLPELIQEFQARKAVAMFISVRPHLSIHFVRCEENGQVRSIDDVMRADAWINGGFFILSNRIFDYIRPGEELVVQPFQRLIAEGKLFARRYDGFWRAVDTFKDLQEVERLVAQGNPPWQVWRTEKPESALPGQPAKRLASRP